MLDFIARRLIAIIPVLAVVAVLVFLMLRLTPGDPAAVIAGDNATSDQIADIREKLGLNEPIWHAVRHLDRQHPAGQFRRELLLQEDRGRADRPAHRADPGARHLHPDLRRLRRRADRRDGRLPPGLAVRPRRHGLLGAGLLGAGLRHRLLPDLRLRHRARLAAGPGLHPHRRRFLAVPRAHDPALAHPVGRLHRADRAHHPRLGAGGAERGLHPHRPRQGPAPTASC